MLKDGDRFFFTHSEGPKAMGLSLEVQDMLLQRTLSDIICQNTQDISQLPKNVFLQSDIPVSCEQRPDLDFNAIARILNSSSANNTSQAALVPPPEYPKTEDEEEQEENKMGHETTYANENYFSNDSRYASAETGKQENNEKEDREEEEEDNSQEPTKDIYLNRK